MPLGVWPTPITQLTVGGRALWVKREDLSSPTYGGNKVRTLEVLLAQARDAGRSGIWSLGCYGSNHALAAAMHAPAAGLRAAALLVPQPATPTARDNLAVLLARPGRVEAPHWLTIPMGGLRMAWSVLRGAHGWMRPGGATPPGAIGHVSEALEVAEQIEAGDCPPPTELILPYGSGCTTAGLTVGIALARHLGLGFDPLPRIRAVCIGPRLMTSRTNLLLQIRNTRRYLQELGGPDLQRALHPVVQRLQLDRRWVGRGYGHVTQSGRQAITTFAAAGLPGLDTTYSAKAGASVLDRLDSGSERILWWFTKSAAPLGAGAQLLPQATPQYLARWLRDGASAG